MAELSATPISSDHVHSVNAALPIRNPQSAIRNIRNIRVLPPEVTSRIAAGEVIERPASVLKELVENALDAGARSIDVSIAAGGRELVRVSDDGCGMDRDDLELSVLPHATSKLTTAEDLSGLSTLGFRGEALPSIASVSKFSIHSRPRVQNARESSAWKIEITGGEPAAPQARPASGATGTIVEVRDLFFNLPARAKFLKGQATEAAACTETFLRLALTRPDVAFAIRQERHEIFSVPAVVARALDVASEKPLGHAAPALPPDAYLARARAILGRHNSQGLLPLDTAASDNSAGAGTEGDPRAGYRLFGLISPPALTRPNRSQIYLNVNGRPVKDRTLTSALLEAYRHLLPARRYPLAVLFLELPGDDVDLNVHPTKAEVRFRLPGLVYALLHHAVREACGVRSPDANAAAAPVSTPAKPRVPLGAPRPEHGQQRFDLWPRAENAQTAEGGKQKAGSDGEKREVRSQESEVGSQQAETRSQSTLPLPHFARRSPAPPLGLTSESRAGYGPSPASAPASSVTRRPPPVTPSTEPRTPDPGPRISAAAQAVAPFRVLGQAAGAYIVLEDDSGIKLIDQHALHERVLFELLLARAKGHSRGDAQGLLIAETLELTPVQAAVFMEDAAAAETLKNIGFDVELFGPRTVAVRAVPTILKNSAAAHVRDVLDAFAGSDDDAERKKPLERSSYREKAAYILSCKGAIKAGERMTSEQMTALVAEFKRLVGEGGFTCPHGRPLALELTWNDLERAVGRA